MSPSSSRTSPTRRGAASWRQRGRFAGAHPYGRRAQYRHLLRRPPRGGVHRRLGEASCGPRPHVRLRPRVRHRGRQDAHWPLGRGAIDWDRVVGSAGGSGLRRRLRPGSGRRRGGAGGVVCGAAGRVRRRCTRRRRRRRTADADAGAGSPPRDTDADARAMRPAQTQMETMRRLIAPVQGGEVTWRCARPTSTTNMTRR